MNLKEHVRQLHFDSEGVPMDQVPHGPQVDLEVYLGTQQRDSD